MARNYENFDLEIRGGDDGYTVHLVSPAGRVTAPFRIPLTDQELKILGLTVARGRRTRALASTREVDEVKAYGQRLFDGLFTGDVLGSYQASLGGLRADRHTGLRIRLRLTDAPELAQIPWEYLYDAPNRRFLALEDETPIVRYLDLPLPTGPLRVEPPLRILVMIASPGDIPPLDVAEEWARLNQALADLVRAGHVELHRLDHATVSGLRWKLKEEEFHVFHFIGHGGVDGPTGRGVLIFEDTEGRSDAVDAETVAGLLSAERTLRLAVLNACEGGRASAGDIYAGTAQTLVQRDVPAVIAMQFEISDEAAIALTHDFYKALSLGDPVDAALTEARRGLRWEQRNELEWGTPVLYTRAADGRLFDVTGEARPPDASTLPPAQPPSEVVEASAPGQRPATPEDRDRARRIAGLIHESQLAVYSERWGDAAALLQEVLDLEPEHGEAIKRLAAVRREEQVATLYRTAADHQQAGDIAAAVAGFERVRDIDPEYRGVTQHIKLLQKEQKAALSSRRVDTGAADRNERSPDRSPRSRAPRIAAGAALVVAGGLAFSAWYGEPSVVPVPVHTPAVVEPEAPDAPAYEPPYEPDPAPATVASPMNRDAEARQLGLVPAGSALTGRLAEGGEQVYDLPLQAGNTYVIAGSCNGACEDLDLAMSEVGNVIAVDDQLDAEPVVTLVVLVTATYQLHVTMPGCAAGSCAYRVQPYR